MKEGKKTKKNKVRDARQREREGGRRRGRKKESTISSQPFGNDAVVGDSETCAAILSRRGPSLGASHTPPSLDKSKKKKKKISFAES